MKFAIPRLFQSARRPAALPLANLPAARFSVSDSQAGPRIRRAGVALAAALAVGLTGASAAWGAPIEGTVTDRTTNRPSAGDTVALIRLAQGMQEAAHATTDARGHYTLEVNDADQMHLVRVTHQKANYFQPVPPGTQTVNVDVYDSADKVPGVTTEADVMRMEADSSGLHVTENFFVRNASSPPRTQFGARAYEIYLPPNAQILAAAALGPGSMPVQSAPVPLGEPGHYTFIFPLRPGETRFQVSYRVPYSGSVELKPRAAEPVDNLAIILPKSMQFSASPASAFQPIDQDVNVQTYLTKNVTPGEKLALRIAGTGQLPQQSAEAQGADNNGQGDNGQSSAAASASAGPEAGQPGTAASDNRPGGGLGVPIDTPDPLHKYKWWILSLVAVLLAVGAGVSMKQAGRQSGAAGREAGSARAPARAAAATTPTAMGAANRVAAGTRGSLLDALKEELFALETERLENRIDPEEYERQKAALEIVLKRALERKSGTRAGAAV